MVQSGDINLNVDKISSCRRMCNKLWNTTKFLHFVVGDKWAGPNFDLLAK